jgi:diaminopimelate epimerase
MTIRFYKYQGAGNDFVMIDNRVDFFPKKDINLIQKLCDRRLGIGADGLILLEEHSSLDFRMDYYNADGKPSSMCGNGGRCIVKFAKQLGVIGDVAKFEAVDGFHEAEIKAGEVMLKMNDVENIDVSKDFTFLNTGSPHHVERVQNLAEYDVKTNGALIRNSRYGLEGANVNFIEQTEDGGIFVRTYERGVEGETLSCGTGVTAVALSLYENKMINTNKVVLKTAGGALTVRFDYSRGGYRNIYLEGPALFVYKGVWE